jgi:hypothetical protein
MLVRPLRVFFFATVIFSSVVCASSSQSPSPGLAGVWVLNPALTQRPAEIGFSPDWARGEGPRGGGQSEGGRGRRSGSGGAMGVPPIARESADDSTRASQLTAEVRTPPARLTIIQKSDAILITDDQGRVRTLHPNGTHDELTIGTVPLPTTARWDAGSLLIVFDVAQGRQLRYALSTSSNPTQLLVEVTFVEHGKDGDKVRFTYEPAGAPATPSTSSTSPTSTPPSAGGLPAGGSVPATPGARPPVLPPGSELRGLTTIGTVVEDLTSSAAACGLDQSKVKSAIAKVLADAGFKSQPFGDEESYVEISIVTSRLGDGTCVSRYDASLVAQADATFPYLKGLVSVPVQLLHEGGMSGSAPATHGSAVINALAKSVNGFVAQIRSAGK